MSKIEKRIEIIRSNNSRLSSLSEQSCSSIYNVLKKHYVSVGVTTINKSSDLKKILEADPDLAFMGINYVALNSRLLPNGYKKRWVSEYLEKNDVAYTGSPKGARRLESNKAWAKQAVSEAGLDTARHFVSGNTSLFSRRPRLNYPVFIKPVDRGGGLGIDSGSLARNSYEMKLKVRSIAKIFHSSSIVEEYLPGREFSVAILKKEWSDGYNLMPLELIAPQDLNGARFLSSEVKSGNTEDFTAVNDPDLRLKVNELALNVFLALGARDYGRIDIRLDRHEVPHFIEANLTPSLIAGYGSFPKACMLNIGLGYEQMILTIVRLAMLRAETEFVDQNIPVLNVAPLAP